MRIRHKGLRALHKRDDPARLPAGLVPRLRRILFRLQETAHQAIDRAVDHLYRRARFVSESERVEHLFKLYEKMRAPLKFGMKSKRQNRRRR